MRRLRDEGGVVAVMMALVVCFVMVPLAAFAVDIGMQRVLRRDMQSMADVVALNTARHLDGRTQAVIKATSEWRGDIHDSVADNLNLALGDGKAHTVDVKQQQEDAVATVSDSDLKVTVTMGMVDKNGDFTAPIPYPDVPNAVRVVASSTIGHTFTGGSGGASRTAIASSQAGACFSIGSYAARLDTGESPILGPLLGALGSNVELTALDYTGLAHTDISLADFLSVNLGAGTMESLIEGDKLIGINDFYLAVAKALEKGSGNTAEVTLLKQISTSLPGLEIPIGKLLDLGTGSADAGLDAMLNVFDLISAAAVAADGTNGVAIPGLDVDLGVVNAHAQATVVEPPQIGCGRKGDASARNSQIQVQLSSDAINVPGLATVSLNGTIDVASATGTLDDVRCAPPGISVAVNNGLLDVDLTLHVTVLGLFNVKVVDAPVHITGTSPGWDDAEAVVDVTDGDYGKPAHVGSGNSGLPWLNIDTSQLKVLGIPLGNLTDWLISPLLSTVINPLIQGLDHALLSPLLNTLGMDLSGADVFAKPTPQCGYPKLVG